jgi:surface polysaccharide O-acyltransferase-like enzyme
MDALRMIATIAVITVHVSTPVVKMVFGVNMGYWWIGNVVDSTVRFCVPAFLMLSGATLLTKEYSIGEFYKKRMMRVLVPFLFWIPVYWIFRWITLPYQQPKTIETIFKWAIDLFLNEGISKHFWYIYMILFLYLFIPFVGKPLRKMSKNSVLYILIAWFLLNGIHMTNIINMNNWPALVNKVYYYFRNGGYMVLGFYLINFKVTLTRTRIIAACVFILSIAWSAIATYFSSKKINNVELSYYGYLSINSIVQSIAIFFLIKDSTIHNKILVWLRNIISDYSYGIYLVHIIVIGVFFDNGIFWTMAHPLISLPTIILSTLVVSICIIFLLRKIPFGKYISG